MSFFHCVKIILNSVDKNQQLLYNACDGYIPLFENIEGGFIVEIRIKVTDTEFEDLQARAIGFPSAQSYARSLLFPQHDYARKWDEVKAFISLRTPDDAPFYIRDALPNAPSLFGRWAYEQQIDLGIEPAGKDRKGTNLWRKT